MRIKYLFSLVLVGILMGNAFAGQVEDISRRTYSSSTYDNGNHTLTIQAHAGHIHYKDAQGNFQNSVIQFTDNGTNWSMTQHNYTLIVQKSFTATPLITYTNQFNGANHTITYSPLNIGWFKSTNLSDYQVLNAAQNVTGSLDSTGTVITWTSAFGAGFNFQVTLKRSGFKKALVIPVNPTLTPPTIGYNFTVMFAYTGPGLTVQTRVGPTVFDGTHYVTDNGTGYTIFQPATPSYSSYIIPEYATDSSSPPIKTSVSVFYELYNSSIVQGKVIPVTLFSTATYPLSMDTTTNYTVGTGNGWVEYAASSVTWTAARAVATGSSFASDGTVGTPDIFVIGEVFLGNTTILRSFFPVDTSAIGAGATVTAATFYAYSNSAGSQNNETTYPANLALVTTSQASPTTLTVSDYPQSGTTRICNTDVLLSNWAGNADQYYSWALNATGLAAVNVTGYTLIGLRSANDFSNSTVPTSRSNAWGLYTESATNDPYLSVTYTSSSKFPGLWLNQ